VTVTIVGRGRLGTGLLRALAAAGAEVRATSARAPRPAALRASRIWLLAVPDPVVATVASRLVAARHGGAGVVVLHTSASLPVSALDALSARGASVGVMHPIVSFASKARPPALAGATFVLGGSPAAVTAGRAIARRVGARAIARPIHGPRYHAALALVANGAAALAGAAERELVRAGLPSSDARRAIGALLRSVAHNVGAVGMPGALTGPIARGDAGAVRTQRAALAGTPSGALYDALAPALLAEAQRAGLRPAAVHAVRAELGKRR
jgi:predicted short-subunit dehydrogenase-like oxidoreductase (DUF2520 family)